MRVNITGALPSITTTNGGFEIAVRRMEHTPLAKTHLSAHKVATHDHFSSVSTAAAQLLAISKPDTHGYLHTDHRRLMDTVHEVLGLVVGIKRAFDAVYG